MASNRQTNAGGTNGSAVAAASGGSADGSTPYNAVSVVAGGTLNFDNTHVLFPGGMAVQSATGATSGVAYASWTTNITYAVPMYTSVLCYFPANPSTAFSLLDLLVSGTIMCRVQLGVGGLLQGFDSAGVGAGALTNAVPLNAYFRVDLKLITASATVGQHEVRLFTDPFSSVPLETKTSAATMNTSTGTPTELRMGHAQLNTASQAGFWWTYPQADTVAYPIPPRTLIRPSLNLQALPKSIAAHRAVLL